MLKKNNFKRLIAVPVALSLILWLVVNSCDEIENRNRISYCEQKTETLIASKYEITKKKRSLIDTTKLIYYTDGLYCPRCRKILKYPDHGERIRCSKCNLEMTRYGNALECVIKRK